MEDKIHQCCFCGYSDLTLKYKTQTHPVIPAIGKVDIYVCNKCLSAVTLPVPDKEMLNKLYGSFQLGMQSTIQQMRKESPLDAIYLWAIKKAIKKMPQKIEKNSVFTWVDMGAGDGILSAMLADEYPNSKGVAVDFHPRPERLNNYESLKWINADLNQEVLTTYTGAHAFDLVISLAVLEHIQDPYKFVKGLFLLLNKKGVLYIACPAQDSFASKIMGKKWPYFIPAEHINIPSQKGMLLLLKRIAKEYGKCKFEIFVNGILVPYPIRYFFNYFKLRRFASLLSPSFTLKMPSGALEAGVISLL